MVIVHCTFFAHQNILLKQQLCPYMHLVKIGSKTRIRKEASKLIHSNLPQKVYPRQFSL
jgi:ornithine cyclodeaminase/alanine dehydrogenase-like protein (mu-crystallin family)